MERSLDTQVGKHENGAVGTTTGGGWLPMKEPIEARTERRTFCSSSFARWGMSYLRHTRKRPKAAKARMPIMKGMT